MDWRTQKLVNEIRRDDPQGFNYALQTARELTAYLEMKFDLPACEAADCALSVMRIVGRNLGPCRTN